MSVRYSILIAIILVFKSFAYASSKIEQPYVQGYKVPKFLANDLRRNIVLNGRNVTEEDFGGKKFVVRLVINNPETNTRSTCTGFVVARDLIMTAGHCLSSKNLEIKVQYGFGGEFGFDHFEISTIYRGHYWNANGPKGKSRWRDGYLHYNEEKADSFKNIILNSDGFVNEEPEIHYFSDFGLIKISELPKDYSPVRFYSGRPKFRQEVFIPGFGTDSRIREEVTDRLKVAEMSLVGRVISNNKYVGFGSYSKSDNEDHTCAGDSGAPVVTYNAQGELTVLGINIFSYNNCANGSWSVNPEYYKSLLDMYITLIRSTSAT